jgi:hydrogenase maturation protease
LSDSKILILGIGNPIRNDDAVGRVVAERVNAALSAEERQSIVVRNLDSGGWNLIPEVEGFDDLIVVDAYHAEDAVPGRVRALSASTFAASERLPDSAHLISLSDALCLSKSLGYRTPSLLGAVAVDVTDSCMSFGQELSEEVEAVVPLAAEYVLGLARKRLSI